MGLLQAEELSKNFDVNNYDYIFSSDLSRAYDTCRILVKNQKEILAEELLRERAFGYIEGKSLDFLKNEAAKKGFSVANLSQFTAEGGESLEQVNERVRKFFNFRIKRLDTFLNNYPPSDPEF